MTRTARKMFKDVGYEYSEKYTTDDEKSLEYIQYESEHATIKFYIRGKFWGKYHKKGDFGSKYEYDKYVYATAEETEAIVEQCKELNWINNNPKEETNFEHYFEKIKELVSMHFRNPQAIANGLMAVSDEEAASLCIKDVKVLQNMQKKGYFRNVDNYTPIRDILKCSEIKKGEKA